MGIGTSAGFTLPAYRRQGIFFVTQSGVEGRTKKPVCISQGCYFNP